jgi:hypothetical protein
VRPLGKGPLPASIPKGSVVRVRPRRIGSAVNRAPLRD